MVKAGYKQTEVGEIPEDWELNPLGQYFDFKNGLNKAKEFFGHGTPIINYMDVFNNPGVAGLDIVGKVAVTNDEINSYGARKGDVFFTRTSETVEEIGLSTVLTEEVKNAVFSGFVLRAREKGSDFDLQFKKYCFRSEPTRKQIKATSSYTTRALTNGKLLSQVLLAYPKEPGEQKAIADALSDVDALIVSLEKLIEKKRDIKTATMQQLLTGKKRLPGFGEGKGTKQTELGEIPEDWDVLALGDLLRIRHGKSQKDVESPGGDYPILATGGEIGRAKQALYSKPSVLIGRKGTIDVPYYMDTPFWTVDTLFYSEISDRADAKFLFYKFHFIDWYKYNEASGVPSLSSATIEKIPQAVPKKRSEQESISSFISDFDSEISLLESKLTKTKAIKQGMMQELLTGRTRLV